MYSSPDLESVYCSISSSNCCFLTCMQISQESCQVVWYSHLFKNFPQFLVIHTVKEFIIVSEIEATYFYFSGILLLFLWSNQIRSDQSLSRVRLFATSWIAARQASLSITNSQSSLRLTSIESVMPSSHLLPVIPYSSCPKSLPASESFPMRQIFVWGDRSIGISALASVLPKNTQNWSPLEWTGWISLQSKGLSRVFSNTTDQKHQFFCSQLSSQSNSHIHTWPLEKP